MATQMLAHADSLLIACGVATGCPVHPVVDLDWQRSYDADGNSRGWVTAMLKVS